MAKEPKTCWTCKFRLYTSIYLHERKSHYYCWENPVIQDSLYGTCKIKRPREVGGRHWKCDKYERRQQ